MSFSKEWEKAFNANTHISLWPWSDVVSLIHNNCKSMILKSENTCVLELGCGAGANIPFFKKLGINYYAIEGSQTIVKKLHERFPEMKNQIVCGDFTLSNPFNKKFDLVLDRASITHNNLKAIKQTIDIVINSLKNNALFIGIDWFSSNHSDLSKGFQIDDEFTRTNFPDGPFFDIGKVHFSDLSHLKKLLNKFDIKHIEEKVVKHYNHKNIKQFASWNFVARKINA